MISQNIISPICVEKGKRQSRQTAVNVKDGNEVKSSQSLFKHGKIHQEFKKLKIT